MDKAGLVEEHYVERDVSWMYFNHRILQEAQKEGVPLLERLSFLGIYSNNLDEFFRVRMASLSRVFESGNLPKRSRERVKKTIKTINRLNREYSKEYSDTVAQVFEGLEEHGIRMIRETELEEAQKEWLTDLFYDKLNGMTNPIWLKELKNIGKLEDNRIYLVVEMTERASGAVNYALVKVPDRTMGRFIEVPTVGEGSTIMYLDDVVRFCLPLIFAGLPKSDFRAYSMKFTKDAEMEMGDDPEFSAMQKVAQGVSSRKKGNPLRVIYDGEMPEAMQKKIFDRLETGELNTLLASNRYQNHKDLMKFPDCGHKELRYPRWQQVMKREFVGEESIIDLIRKKDRFLHVPYESFNGYIRLLREAALSPDVKEIKTTLYRLAKDSKVVKALICAAQNGKKVTAVVELLARFDEESNIKWSKRMQENGVNVIFGVEGLKIHSKLLHIHAKSGDLAVVGTGNFHEGNAKGYTDYLMMTARRGIVNEVGKVFDFIDRPFTPVRFSRLLVSPNAMKTRILRLFDNEIRAAREGREAWVKIKINHITDVDMVEKIYEASQAGVDVQLLVRGNCSIVPGVEGVSDGIKAVGIIDRFLEHPRILIFANGGKPKFYIGSADWMPRNLIDRIEVMTPVYDADLKADLLRTVEYGLRDTCNGRLIDGRGGDRMQEGEPFRSQEALQEAYTSCARMINDK